jgi:hypothetical protein
VAEAPPVPRRVRLEGGILSRIGRSRGLWPARGLRWVGGTRWSVADAADALGIKGQRLAAVESGELPTFATSCCCAVSVTSTWKSSVTGYSAPMRPPAPRSLSAAP